MNTRVLAKQGLDLRSDTLGELLDRKQRVAGRFTDQEPPGGYWLSAQEVITRSMSSRTRARASARVTPLIKTSS